MTTTTLSALDDLIVSRSLLKHPFYVKWTKGELTLDDLKVYAKEYYHLVKAVPGVVSCVRERTVQRHPEMLKFIDENIVEEKSHVDLWKKFAGSLGISEQELESYQPSAKACEAVEKLKKTAELGFDEGVSAMYSLELELPKIAKTKKEGLCDFYDLTSKDAHVYFDEHLHEEKHLAVWRMVSIDCKKAEEAAVQSLDAQNQLLDAVCDICDIECDC